MTPNNEGSRESRESQGKLANSSSVESSLADVRKRLVDTGTRNRLVHVNRVTKRSSSLNIINERTEDIFDLLRMQGKRMRFTATGMDEDHDNDGENLVLAPYTNDEEFDSARYRDSLLETALGPEKLERRLLRLFTDARTSEEEHGFNILYLAMGFLRWFESKPSDKIREAPLVLMPVQLRRNEKRATFDISARDDDIVTNLPLQERLKNDFGIKLPDIEDTDDWGPVSYLRQVAELVSERDRWEVDEDGMQLGFFSFAKLLMLRDLDPANWPGDTLQKNTLVKGLLSDGFEPEPSLFLEEDRLDERLEPKDIVQVVDADASQTKVIEEVRAGRNLIVQGPPGTGKSQTIANIIAGAVHDGKTVLFVAEKMAALNVVYSRLNKIKLGDLCIELHSRKANKKNFLLELQRTLAEGRSTPEMPGQPDVLRKARDGLNRITELLHVCVPNHAFTPFSVMSEISGFIGRNIPPPELKCEGLEELDDSTRRDIKNKITDYVTLLRKVGPRQAHPFYGVAAYKLQPTDVQRLEQALADTQTVLTELVGSISHICNQASLERPTSFEGARSLLGLLQCLMRRPVAADIAAEILLSHLSDPRMPEALAAGREWREARDSSAECFWDAAWDTPIADLRARLASGIGSFWKRCFGSYRGASAEFGTLIKQALPKVPADRLALLDRLLEVQAKRRKLANDEVWLSQKFGDIWRGEQTDFARLQEISAWLKDFMGRIGTVWTIDPELLRKTATITADSADMAQTLSASIEKAQAATDIVLRQLEYVEPDGRDLQQIPLSDLVNRLSIMATNLDRYGEWRELETAIRNLRDCGLEALLADIEDGRLAPDSAVDEFLYATADARWRVARSSLKALDDLGNLDRHELVRKFQNLDKERLVENRELLRALHCEKLPTGGYGEMGFLRGEMAKKRRHHPIRKIIRQAGGVIQRIKPVFMMSPISIAQFLPPGEVTFDLLVIDEASQVRPEEVLGAIARCGQIAVVGDQKQLPPTSFFDRIAGDDEIDEDDDEPHTARLTEVESILTLCEARGLNNGMLTWHYRSRDPSLIAVNNAEFYDHRLILPPSPVQDDTDYGLTFTRVPGVYSSRSRGGGRPGTNRIEAEAVAQRLVEHAQQRPNLSVGVVAFSKAQSDMITEVLEIMRRKNPHLEALLRENKPENVFVKNIENVQGDERDVILITVGYGPHTADARLASMSFGPVNGERGERRLNVLFSRARMQCAVFCSFDPGDIDLSRTSRKGPEVLKRFLEHAKSGQTYLPQATGADADSFFEEDVATIIRARGYECDPQVGSAGFRIDLGVRNPDRPGQYILAVECDGATYHSALWARERDRLRQDVLESMGWRFHRIWSTDWFYRRKDEMNRLHDALDAARASTGPNYVGSNEKKYAPKSEPKDPTPEKLPDLDRPLRAPPYRRADIRFHGSEKSPVDIALDQLGKLAKKIVDVEGPIHIEELSKRVAAAFGLLRAGRRIKESVLKAVKLCKRDGCLLTDGDFCMTQRQWDAPPVRDRSAKGLSTMRATYIAPAEIRAAASMVERESGCVPEAELITATARLLGFGRTGQDVRDQIATALETSSDSNQGIESSRPF